MSTLKYLLYLVTILQLLSSCSEQKKIARFVKKHGPKQVAAHITAEYPEYFKSTSQLIDTSIKAPVRVVASEVVKDTTFNDQANPDPDTTGCIDDDHPSENCFGSYFDYKDKNLEFHARLVDGETNIRYRIPERIIHDTVSVPVKVLVPGAPCPQEPVLEELRKNLTKEQLKKDLFRNPWFWIPWILLGINLLFGRARHFKDKM